MTNISERLSLGLVYLRLGLNQVLVDRVILFIDIFVSTGLMFLSQYLIWSHLLVGQGVSGMSLLAMLSYYLFTICLSRFNNGYGVIEDLSSQVYTGKIELALIKPISYQTQKLFEYLGGSLVYLPLALLPAFLMPWISGKGFGLMDLWFLGQYMPLLVLSQILCFWISFFIAQITFFTEKNGLVLALYSSLAAFFGGLLLPGDFWPLWLKPLMTLNPFYFTMGAIAEYSSTRNFSDLLFCLSGQLVWVSLFFGASQMSWKFVTKDYKGKGG